MYDWVGVWVGDMSNRASVAVVPICVPYNIKKADVINHHHPSQFRCV